MPLSSVGASMWQGVLDDLTEGVSIIEVDYRPQMADMKTAVGVYGGIKRSYFGNWYLKVQKRYPIHTMDVVDIRELKQPAGRSE